MFTQVEDMFAICFETSIKHVEGHVYTMFTFMFTPCLNTCSHRILRFVHKMLEYMWICLQYVWRQVLTMFKGMFLACLKTCVQQV